MSTDGSLLGFSDASTNPNVYATAALTAGPDAALWYIDTGLESDPQLPNLIGRMAIDGSLTEYSTGPSPDDSPQLYSLVTGADGNIWFAQGASRIAKMTTQGVITSYASGVPGALISNFVLGSDGNVWFSYFENQPPLPHGVGKVTPDGTVTIYPITDPFMVVSLTTGPDGNLWGTTHPLQGVAHDVVKITTSGAITVIPVTVDSQQGLGAIVAAPDGNLWFTIGFAGDGNHDGIVRLTPQGVTTEFLKSTPVTNQNSILGSIAIGPDGNIWFTESNALASVAVTSCPNAAPTPIAAAPIFTG
jgi:streptogramin lyase